MKYAVRRIGVLVLVFLLAGLVIISLPRIAGMIIEMRQGQEFVPGLHEPRTGDTAEDVTAWAPPEAEVLFEVYFDTRCLACASYADALQEALEIINAGELSGKIAFVAVNIGQQTDKEVKDFANEHKLTFPVLAGADEKHVQRLRIEAVPTTYFWFKIDGEWGIIDRTEGDTSADAVVQIATLFYEVMLHPQLHDVRTGETGENLLDFIWPDVQIFFAVYVDTGCTVCSAQVQELIDAFSIVMAHPYGHRAGFLVINGLAESDKMLWEFIDAESIPEVITVLAGAPIEGRGIPAEVEAVSGAELEITKLPAIILFFEERDGWLTWGFYQGEILEAKFIVDFFDQYVRWRQSQGF